jgi:hypothetical protein
MNDDEYERRKRALEEMYQADLTMVRAAHETRLRCLDALRQASPSPADSAAGLRPPTPPPPTPQPAARNQNPDLREAVLEALPSLPELFTKDDVVRAIGFTPSRSSLQRILMDLDAKKTIRFEELSQGRHPTTYRKL